MDLAQFRESDEDDRLGQNAVPVHGFCLPGRAEEIKNTCLPIAKVKKPLESKSATRATDHSPGDRLLHYKLWRLSLSKLQTMLRR